MHTVILIRGALGVGKTTVAKDVAKKLNAEYFSIDRILEELQLDKSDGECIPAKNFIAAQEHTLPQIKASLTNGRSVVIDGNFYHKEQIEFFNQHFKTNVRIFTLHAPVEVCIERDSKRKKPYGEDAARAVHSLVSRFDAGVVIDTTNKSILEVVQEIVQFTDSNGEIRIERYNPVWPKKFLVEKKLIEETIGPWIDGGIHHVGSTAVPDLPAKPIVDIQVGVKNLKDAKACIPLLESIGYCYYPYRPYMHWFCKPSPLHRELHVQLMEPTHPQWNARLAFRDYLRTHPETAKEYAMLKEKLAEKFRDDREAYTEAKGTFIESVMKKAANEL